jgi:FMN phosphatase YigB (HAD superfamily)
LATAGCGPHQRRKLAASGLGRYFSRVFISGEVGVSKATAEFAALIQARLEAEGREVCLVVGDKAKTDLALAAAGGWPAVHLCDPTACPESSPTVRHSEGLAGVAPSCGCRF